jgi:hypothetical protein
VEARYKWRVRYLWHESIQNRRGEVNSLVDRLWLLTLIDLLILFITGDRLSDE